MSELSRYRREFQELNFIAGGGFGKVFRALHRLDGTEYAIKKIIVSSKCMKTIEQYLNEVKTLAKLNHANIVPYKAAWIESTFLPLFFSNISSQIAIHINCVHQIARNSPNRAIHNLLKIYVVIDTVIGKMYHLIKKATQLISTRKSNSKVRCMRVFMIL